VQDGEEKLLTKVSIEVDKHTADVLQMRAAERGVTVPQVIAILSPAVIIM
jgi:hypothetical protein